jgi:hypothetical protein
MKTAFWQASFTASQAGENSQTNGIKHNIESSILTHQASRKPRRKNDTARYIFKPAKKYSSTNASRHNNCINFNINFDPASQKSNRHNNCINFNINFDLEVSKIRTEQMSKIQRIH